MEYIINLFSDPDVIIKGAIGSAVCFFVVSISGKVLKLIYGSVARFSGKFRKQLLQSEWTPLNAIDEESQDVKVLSYLLCLYPAFHKLLKALIFVVIGLWLSLYSDIFASSAYFCALYFLFSSLSYVPDFGVWGDREKRATRLKELNEKLDEIS